jgi:acyl carrier protein
VGDSDGPNEYSPNDPESANDPADETLVADSAATAEIITRAEGVLETADLASSLAAGDLAFESHNHHKITDSRKNFEKLATIAEVVSYCQPQS